LERFPKQTTQKLLAVIHFLFAPVQLLIQCTRVLCYVTSKCKIIQNLTALKNVRSS